MSTIERTLVGLVLALVAVVSVARFAGGRADQYVAAAPPVAPVATLAGATMATSAGALAADALADVSAGARAMPTTTPAPAPAPVPTTAAPESAAPTSTAAPAPVACTEDMPCWDCATMGNGQCGPTSAAVLAPPATSAPLDGPAHAAPDLSGLDWFVVCPADVAAPGAVLASPAGYDVRIVGYVSMGHADALALARSLSLDCEPTRAAVLDGWGGGCSEDCGVVD